MRQSTSAGYSAEKMRRHECGVGFGGAEHVFTPTRETL
jgi:hypothetical protein